MTSDLNISPVLDKCENVSYLVCSSCGEKLYVPAPIAPCRIHLREARQARTVQLCGNHLAHLRQFTEHQNGIHGMLKNGRMGGKPNVPKLAWIWLDRRRSCSLRSCGGTIGVRGAG